MGNLEEKKIELKEEIEKLKYEFKVDLPKRIAEARAYGDLRENAEYDAARERQAFVKARISQLSEQMSRLSEISTSDVAAHKVSYGTVVTVIDLDSDDRTEFTIVSSNEVNPSEGKISLSSPIGQALANRSVGEEIIVTIPSGKRKYYIEKIVSLSGETFEAVK